MCERQTWLEAHPGWAVAPEEVVDEDSCSGDAHKLAKDDAGTDGDETADADAGGEPETAKTRTDDDEYKKAEGEANYYRSVPVRSAEAAGAVV